MSRAFSSGSVGFVLVCANLLPVTSHFMTPSTTHIGFTGSSPVQEIQGNPAQRVRLIRRLDKVPHWEYAVSSGPFFGNPAYYRIRYSRPPAPTNFYHIDSVYGNPAHRVLLIRRSDTVPYWEYAVSSEPFFGNSAYYRIRYLRPPAPRLCPLICKEVPKISAYQVSTSCQQISLRLPNQTCFTRAERVKDIPAKSSITVHHVHPPLPQE